MLRKISVIGILCFLFITAKLSFGLKLDYRDYEVKRGDTLWDISESELDDPFLWPNIWKENPEITNPDLIYPTQHIRIPIYLLQEQVELAPPPAPEVAPPTEVSTKVEIPEKKPQIEEPVPRETIPAMKEYLFDRNLVMVSGYISREIPSVGNINSSPSGRIIMGKGDYVYIEVKGDTTPGRKFYAFRQPFEQVRKVKHPKGGFMGYLIEITGILEIVGQESGNTKAVITESFLDVAAEEEVGNYLLDYYEIEPPLKTDPPRTPDIKGFIVHTRDQRVLNAQYDIVYIDKGSNDGVLPGDVFNITSGEYPHVHLGKMVVILTKDTTSTALVTASEDVVGKGDVF